MVEDLTKHFKPVYGKRPKTLRVTNSSMKEFMECKRKWMLHDMFGFAKKNQAPVGPLALGTRVHNALEYLYNEGEGLLEEYSRLAEIDRELFMQSPDGYWTEKVDEFNSEVELGRIMLEGYLEWAEEEGLDADIEVIGAEMSLVTTIKDGKITLMGKKDLTIRDHIDDSTIIRDFKTAQNFADYDKMAPIDPQLPFYQLLQTLVDPTELVDGGQFVVLRKVKRTARSKPPFYKIFRVRANDHRMESMMLKVDGVTDEMLSTRNKLLRGQDHRKVAYPNPTRDCSWKCPFYNVCPMMDDGSDYVRMLQNEYEQVNPLARYGEES